MLTVEIADPHGSLPYILSIMVFFLSLFFGRSARMLNAWKAQFSFEKRFFAKFSTPPVFVEPPMRLERPVPVETVLFGATFFGAGFGAGFRFGAAAFFGSGFRAPDLGVALLPEEKSMATATAPSAASRSGAATAAAGRRAAASAAPAKRTALAAARTVDEEAGAGAGAGYAAGSGSSSGSASAGPAARPAARACCCAICGARGAGARNMRLSAAARARSADLSAGMLSRVEVL